MEATSSNLERFKQETSDAFWAGTMLGTLGGIVVGALLAVPILLLI